VAAGLRKFQKADLLGLPALAFVAGVFGIPVLLFLGKAFTDPSPGVQNFKLIASDTLYVRVLWNTVVVSGATTFFALLLGYPFAYTLANTSPRIRRLLIFVVLVPFWTSLLVRAFSWTVLLQPQGLINAMLVGIGFVHKPIELMFNRTGLLIGMVQMQLPFVVFPLYSVMTTIDPAYVRAASGLGASPVRSFWKIYFPLSMPGVLTGGLLVFVTSLGYFITPALLGGLRDFMIAQLIHDQVADIGIWGVPAALSILLLAGTFALFGLAKAAGVRTK